MATILRGKHAGKRCRLHQWCNDWFSVDVGRTPVVVSPLNIKLTRGEVELVRRSFELKSAGLMPEFFDLCNDGTLSRIARYGSPRERKPRATDPLPDGTEVSRQVVNARRRIIRKVRNLGIDTNPLKFSKRQTREQRDNDQGCPLDVNCK